MGFYNISTVGTSFFDVTLTFGGFRPFYRWIQTFQRYLWPYFWVWSYRWNLIHLFRFASFLLSFEVDVHHDNFRCKDALCFENQRLEMKKIQSSLYNFPYQNFDIIRLQFLCLSILNNKNLVKAPLLSIFDTNFISSLMLSLL